MNSAFLTASLIMLAGGLASSPLAAQWTRYPTCLEHRAVAPAHEVIGVRKSCCGRPHRHPDDAVTRCAIHRKLVWKIWHTLRDPAAPTWYGGIWKTWSDTATEGDTSVLIPINTYHMRFAYTPEQVERYTEWPLGLGLGRTHVGETTARMVFAMTMQDSHGTMEYEVGYIWLRNRYPIRRRTRFFSSASATR